MVVESSPMGTPWVRRVGMNIGTTLVKLKLRLRLRSTSSRTRPKGLQSLLPSAVTVPSHIGANLVRDA